VNSPTVTLRPFSDPTTPSKHFAFTNLIDPFPRHHSSLLFQIRTGHTPLNKHLFRILKSHTARCLQCNAHQESVKHFILECPKYSRQRAALRKEAGRQASQLQQLLNNGNCIRPLIRYIACTRKLEHTFCDVTPRNQTNRRLIVPYIHAFSRGSMDCVLTSRFGISVLSAQTDTVRMGLSAGVRINTGIIGPETVTVSGLAIC
jgi:hypothetical protein